MALEDYVKYNGREEAHGPERLVWTVLYTLSKDRSKVTGLRSVVDAIVKKGKDVNSTPKDEFQFGVKGVENCVSTTPHVKILVFCLF